MPPSTQTTVAQPPRTTQAPEQASKDPAGLISEQSSSTSRFTDTDDAEWSLLPPGATAAASGSVYTPAVLRYLLPCTHVHSPALKSNRQRSFCEPTIDETEQPDSSSSAASWNRPMLPVPVASSVQHVPSTSAEFSSCTTSSVTPSVNSDTSWSLMHTYQIELQRESRPSLG